MRREVVNEKNQAEARLREVRDRQRRIRFANHAGVLKTDTLYRVVESKGDQSAVTAFKDRSLTEEGYSRLVDENYQAFLVEKAREYGFWKDIPMRRKNESKKQQIERRQQAKKLELLKDACDLLKKNDWTVLEILDALQACKENSISCSKLGILVEGDVEPSDVWTFFRTYQETKDLIGFTLENFASAYGWAEKDVEKLEEFLEFCKDKPGIYRKIRRSVSNDHLGAQKTLTVLRKMFDVFEVSRGAPADMEEIVLLEGVKDRRERSRAAHAHDLQIDETAYLDSLKEPEGDWVGEAVESFKREQRLSKR